MTHSLQNLFDTSINIESNFIQLTNSSIFENQEQTNKIFTDKWTEVNNKESDLYEMSDFQLKWYLKLYGFNSETELAKFLSDKKFILDAGCGLGYKSAWFAKLAPESLVIGMDFSEASLHAAKRYSGISNLFFVRGDISCTHIRKNTVDYISCDQVIHHTEKPEATFNHLASLLKQEGELACYVYAKKALPRELLDDYFREYSKKLSREDLWQLSKQVTELGKALSDLKIKFRSPDIPALGIKGGEYDVQRFLYWNFLKCFWREDWSNELCVTTNFDWYAPSNAARYSVEEFNRWGENNRLLKVFSHSEEACHTGRFKRNS